MKLSPAAPRGNPSLAGILVILAIGLATVQCLPSTSSDPIATAAAAATLNTKESLAPSGGPEPTKVASDDALKVTGSAPVEAKSVSVQSKQEAPKQESEQEAQARKGRSEPPPAAASSSSPVNESKKSETSTTEKPSSEHSKPPTATKSAQEQQKKQQQANSSSGAKSQLAGKSSASSKKQPSNLGTVTSTGSGGATHYMSKHDAYSAIAEKHGALAQDAMRKSDKRHLQRFGGIQKASGNLGDMLSPFKGVTDSGLARTLGASMRSIMKSKYSVPAYVASALLGAVALMAFYESPMSPLPVPALPEPPVGRFPPEMPSLPPGVQVPFRGSQQYQQLQQAAAYGNQAYGGGNQRSFQAPSYTNMGVSASNQQQQQVLFPGNTAASTGAQQRQSSSPGPVQQLAANLLSTVGGKQQNAQRKSSPDHPDPASSRSLFGGSSGGSAGSPFFSPFNTGKLSAPLNSNNNNNHQAKPSASSFLSYFGLGGQSSSPPSDLQQASSASGTQYLIGSASGLLEPKGQSASGLSNSHVVNKVKSYFNMRPSSGSQVASSPSGAASSSSSSSSANPYEEYQRMSFVQALMKDTAFLPAFLVPSRKSTSSSASPASSSSSSSSSSSTSPSSASSASVQPAAARMQVDTQSILPLVGSANQQQQQYLQPQQSQLAAPAASGKRTSSGFGLGRIAHALLDTFTSSVMQRSAPVATGDKKSSEPTQQSPLVSATSLLTDIMSSYNSQLAAGQQNGNNNNIQEHLPPSQQQQVDLANKQQQQQVQQQQYQNYHQQQQQAAQQATNPSGSDSAMSRALEGSEISSASESGELQKQPVSAGKQTVANSAVATDSNTLSPSSVVAAAPANHVRKTRSIGLEYPIESNQALARRQEQPSRAAQINNLVDYVSDSYSQNRLLFNFVMNQVGLSHAVPYVEQILVTGKESPAQFQ